MITSIVELPDILTTSDYLQGYQECYTNEYDAYAPMNILLSQGRNITFRPFAKMPAKYRINFMTGNSAEHYIVIMALEKINISTFVGQDSLAPTMIFPIYGKIYNKYLVFPERINQFFAKTGCCTPTVLQDDGSVTSTINLCSAIEYSCGNPGTILTDTQILKDFSPIARHDSIIEIISTMMCGYEYKDPEIEMRTRYGVMVNEIPPEIQLFVQHASFSTDLAKFDCPLRRVKSDVQLAVEFSKENWPILSERAHQNNAILLQSTDNIVPCEPTDNSRMGSMIASITEVGADDFWFDVRTSTTDISDFYIKEINPNAGFARTVEQLRGWDTLIHNLTYAADLLGKFGTETVMYAHKSCLEDLTVTDKRTGKILLYIDLVWWTLASAPGLINKAMLGYF